MSDGVPGSGALAAAVSFVDRLWEKLGRDEAFILAAALAWGVLLALLPLLALGIGLTGFVLSARYDDPTDAVVNLFSNVLPAGRTGSDISELLLSLVAEVMDTRAGLTVVGSLVFVWLATSLSGLLRISLSRVFDTGARRGIVHGKAFDVATVLMGVVLVTVNMGVTILFAAAMDFGVNIFGWGAGALSLAERSLGFLVAFSSIWALFVAVYRFLPARRTPWRTTFVAATVAGLAHEALKLAFSWYLTELANYTSTLGNLATVAVLLFWIYYGCLVFIVGGAVAQVYATRNHGSERLARAGGES